MIHLEHSVEAQGDLPKHKCRSGGSDARRCERMVLIVRQVCRLLPPETMHTRMWEIPLWERQQLAQASHVFDKTVQASDATLATSFGGLFTCLQLRLDELPEVLAATPIKDTHGAS